jgi:hypothetical protein
MPSDPSRAAPSRRAACAALVMSPPAPACPMLRLMAREPWFLLSLLALGCGGNLVPTGQQPAPGPPPSPPALTAAELARPWLALAVPQAERGMAHVVRGAQGFVVMSEEPTGAGKTVGPSNDYLYRSDDGITWQRLTMPAMPSYPGLRSLAFGGGRTVMAGSASGTSELWTSSDLSQWSKYALAIPGSGLSRVIRVGGLFFALNTFRDFLVSKDGLSWTLIPSVTLQQTDVAYGNGLFVLVGSGPIRTSRDGFTWDDQTLDCTLPGGCIQDPGGGIHQGYHSHAVFAADPTGGRFYVDQLSSTDGVHWQPHGGAMTAIAESGGYLFGRRDGRLAAWRPGETPTQIAVVATPFGPPLADGKGPETISTPLAGGETCLTHHCVVVDEQLYLIR